jgi:uncharacterized membrane protein YgcG
MPAGRCRCLAFALQPVLLAINSCRQAKVRGLAELFVLAMPGLSGLNRLNRLRRGASWLPFMPFPSSSSRLADLFSPSASQPQQDEPLGNAPPQGVRLGGAHQPPDPKQAAAQAAEARLARGPGGLGGKKSSGGSSSGSGGAGSSGAV